MIAGLDKWQAGFFLCAALLILFEMISGWRRGLVRQLLNMASIVLGYLAGLYGGRLAVPIFRPFGYPDFVTLAAGGTLIALVTMAVLSLIGALVFKKTSQQSLGIVRFFYGLSGACLGAVIGLFFIWIALLGARLVGTVAQSEIRPPGTRPAVSMASTRMRTASSLESRFGANPPSSPMAVDSPRSWSTPAREW